MSTDITTTQASDQSGAIITSGDAAASSNYLKLTTPGSRQARAFMRNFGSTPFNINELAKVRVPSQGATTWLFETIRGDEVHREIEGVIVAMAHRGALWQSEEDIDAEKPPVLSAVSPWGTPLTVAVRPLEGDPEEDFGDIDPTVLERHKLGEIKIGDRVQSVYDWPALPYCQWGTAKKGSGNGKRAKESVDAYLLRADDTLPLQVKIPSASLVDFGKAIRALPFGFDECVVGLSLEKVPPEKGPVYSRVVPRFIKELSEEEADAVIRNLTPVFEASVSQQCLPGKEVAALIEKK